MKKATDKPTTRLPKPGLFVINAENKVQVVECSNCASTRPALSMTLDGIKTSLEKKLPVRGTLA